MSAPLISVVIVCKNPGPSLRSAVASVSHQRDVNIELIIVDGSSTDGTTDWLMHQPNGFAKIVSEADSGIYDAMNKGLALATGHWMLFLGADDRLDDNRTLGDAAGCLNSSRCEVLGGESLYSDGRTYRFSSRRNLCARNFLHHQAAFYRRELFSRFGTFDTSLRIMADYDLNLRLWKNNVPFGEIERRITLCGSGGFSDSGRWSGYAEEIIVRHRYFPIHSCLLWDVGSILRFLRKKGCYR